ncbi:MAG: response regulator [Oscillospiraceae bacterium]|jgi:signal transduction histidine kinase/CheY-like chemotaxis protein|nr:response regulator [Oscillospiraceae bacterium]
MLLKKNTAVLLAVIVLAADAALALAGYYISRLGGLFVLILPVLALLAAGISLLPMLTLLRRLKGGAGKISGFLALAAAGHLEKRIEVNNEEAFAEIEKTLNVMMENLENMSRAKSDFLSSMSHEIRTPMSAIVGMAQIARNATDPVRVADCLQKIEDNSKHLIGVINDILDFSKIESGKLLLDEQLFSLRENLDFIESMFQGKVAEKNLHFMLSVNNIKHDGIVTDSLRLNQVLINLLSNAVKFTDAGGMISLSVEELMHVGDESVYSFAVTDTGIGIAPDQAVKLFTPFVQANAGTAKKYGGTGLGLVISKDIVAKMGGDIELTSTLGVGSTFSFTIRVASQDRIASAEPVEEDDDTPDFHGKRLLIVDDIEINREIALEILRETGVEMETAENGQVALDMFLESPAGYFDMILMDMQMPVMDGCEATEMIRKSEKSDAKTIKIVAVTANVMRDDIARAYASGMDGHLGKPIDFGEAYKTMATMLK